MLTVQGQNLTGIELQPDQPQRVITNAAQLLSSLSGFVGVVTAPRKPASSTTSSSCGSPSGVCWSSWWRPMVTCRTA